MTWAQAGHSCRNKQGQSETGRERLASPRRAPEFPGRPGFSHQESPVPAKTSPWNFLGKRTGKVEEGREGGGRGSKRKEGNGHEQKTCPPGALGVGVGSNR